MMTGDKNLFLGINCGHDAAAVLMDRDRIVLAIPEERLRRDKKYYGAPTEATKAVLAKTGQPPDGSSLTCVVVNAAEEFGDARALFPGLTRVSRWYLYPSHHLLHALYAASSTPDESCAVLVVDGSGYSYDRHKGATPFDLLGPAPSRSSDFEELSAYEVTRGKVRLLFKSWAPWADQADGRFRFASLGHMYSLAAQHIFGTWRDAGKVMGLAPYGRVRPGMPKLVELVPEGVRVSTDWDLSFRAVDRSLDFDAEATALEVAALVQWELERGMHHLVREVRRLTEVETLCLTGGVALNSVVNGQIVRRGLFPRVHITPAAGDAGVAIGAAAYGVLAETDQLPSLYRSQEFFGEQYSDADVEVAIASSPGVTSEVVPNIASSVATDLVAGLSVGFFTGASEFGPRALGHRSILADPRRLELKDRLNRQVKFREPFRPFAACVRLEDLTEWFDLESASPHMLLVAQVWPERRSQIPGVVHVDGTCRLQTVVPEDGVLYQILCSFKAETGVPIVLNTSLNIKGDPIAYSPSDALGCLLASGLDVLYLEGHRVSRGKE